MALTRFKRTLKRARLSVRQLTHTLHLPPPQVEIYDGPRAEWLRDVLEALPNLQSLIVSRLPFFDHQTLLAFQHWRNGHQGAADVDRSMITLKLLIAVQCKNMTATGLAGALTHLSSLAYIDLSGNGSARDAAVLSRLNDMSGLHILRLRNCQLRDSDIEVLGKSIGTRVRSLDLRGNYLTDASIRILLQYCFHSRGTRSRACSGVEVEDSADWPVGIARPDVKILDEFRSEALNQRFVRRLTTGLVNRLPSQDLRQSGVTHLYVAHNHLSVGGVSSLVQNARLYVLDVGSFEIPKVLSKPRAMSSSSPPTSGGYRVALPGAEKLTPILEDFGGDLRYLRSHHALVTQKAAPKQEHATRQSIELNGDTMRNELESIQLVPERPFDEPAPRYELPGNAIQLVSSPAIGEEPSPHAAEETPMARRGSLFAPEVVEQPSEEHHTESILSATTLGSMAQTTSHLDLNGSQENVISGLDGTTGPDTNANLHAAQVEKQFRDLRSHQNSRPHGLLAGMLPQLRTLVLTGVPCFDSVGIVDSLVNFIHSCALEAEIGRLRSLNEMNNSRLLNDRHVSYNKCSLQRLVLEMGPPDSTSAVPGLDSPRAPQTLSSDFRTRSSTEDPDSEALWSAQENDFSFFDDDEECGLPSKKEAPQFPLCTSPEKISMPTNASESEALPALQIPRSTRSGVDVVQELAKFRQERKAAYSNARTLGQTYVEGYWPGEIKIVRWHAKQDYHDDDHGNFYERGIH